MHGNSTMHQLKLPRQRLRAVTAKVFQLRPSPALPRVSSKDVIKIVCISDTHNLQPTLPPGDVLIHAGDMTEWGTFDELQVHLEWISSQPHTYKLVVAGNHDLLFDTAFLEAHPEHRQKNLGRTMKDLDLSGIIYLRDRFVVLRFPEKDGRQVKVYGSPWTPQYGISAFQYPRHSNIWAERVPSDTDILITHGPLLGHLDGGRSAGCAYLLEEVRRVRPMLMVFGHIHFARGEEIVIFDKAQILYEDIAHGSRGWEAVPSLALSVLWLRIKNLMPVASSKCTKLINATIVDSMAKDKALPAFVAEI